MLERSMTEKGNELSKAQLLLKRTFRGNFISIGILFPAIGLLMEGIFPYIGILIGVISILVAYSKLVDVLIQYISQRRGKKYMQFSSVLAPALLSVVTLLLPILMWVAWRPSIPLTWSQNLTTLLSLIVGIFNIVLLALNVYTIFRDRSNP
jgi:hypothetical protein